MPSLIPELTGRTLSVDVALNQPTMIRNRIARLADDQIVLPKLFSTGAQVQGGGMLYSVVKASDFYTTDVEKRAPTNEYALVEGVDPETKLAVVEDWGGKFQVSDEQRDRNVISYIDQQTTQLANTITRKLDVGAIAAVEAAIGSENTVLGNTWEDLVFVGPLDAITPSAERPTADFSAAQLASDLQELGVHHDLLIVHPNQAAALRTAYAENLDAMLTSAGLELFSNPRMTAGVAYVCERGQVGTVGFERPLTVEVWDDRSTRSTWVQALRVAYAYAIERPYALKKLTGLDGAGSSRRRSNGWTDVRRNPNRGAARAARPARGHHRPPTRPRHHPRRHPRPPRDAALRRRCRREETRPRGRRRGYHHRPAGRRRRGPQTRRRGRTSRRSRPASTTRSARARSPSPAANTGSSSSPRIPAWPTCSQHDPPKPPCH